MTHVYIWPAYCFVYGEQHNVGETMKTAITIWNDNRVSPVFDVTGKVLLYESKGERIYSERFLLLPDSSASDKVARLVDAGANVLICGAISKDAHSAATNAGIKVYPFISGDIREIIQACLTGRLIGGGFDMPGCALGMACPGRSKHGRRREQVKAFAFICNQEPENIEV